MEFQWNNTHKRVTLSTKVEGGEWSRAMPFNGDIDALIHTLPADFVVVEHDHGDGIVEVLVKTPTRLLLQFTTTWVYPGLYANVERLLDFVRSAQADATGERSDGSDEIDHLHDVLDAVRDGIKMILAHDQSERDRSAPDGHCRHGVYVGGSGVDWMCGACEADEE
jgi:hypothetical protein